MTQKVKPCLWFDGQAEQAAKYYVSLLPDSRIDQVFRSPAETPSGPAGMVLAVDFTLAGSKFSGLNGGPQFPFTEAVSFQIVCEDQAEVDRLWKALGDGGTLDLGDVELLHFQHRFHRPLGSGRVGVAEQFE